jgi:hypothetical protein
VTGRTAQDVVIVGAPRSGTNMLRDVLTTIPGVTTWPCDEINLIWRHGNRASASDELTPAAARPEVRRYIRRRFDAVRKTDQPIVVEKTCANSLRVEFVRAVLPDAKYVVITRDGLDAAASAMKRWVAPLDLSYTAAKARFVPLSDVAYYGVRFASGRLRRRSSTPGRVSGWWGPRPDDYRELMATHPLDELCAIQWQRCVEQSLAALADLGDRRVHRVRYEEFVTDPGRHVSELASFLGVADQPSARVDGVLASSVGKGRRDLGDEATSRLEGLVASTLKELGYVA